MSHNLKHLNQSREVALQILFQLEFSATIDIKASLRVFKESFETSNEVWEYAEKLIKGIHEHQKEIDTLITNHAKHWTIDRMALVDASLMRVAVYEMKFLDDSPSASINEALELAKKYGSSESSSFINGVLDSIAKGS